MRSLGSVCAVARHGAASSSSSLVRLGATRTALPRWAEKTTTTTTTTTSVLAGPVAMRPFSVTAPVRGPAPAPQPDASPSSSSPSSSSSDKTDKSDNLGHKMLESALTSFASIAMLALGFGIAGYGYHRYYKHLVLRKMSRAFEPGDPVLDLAAVGRGLPGKEEAVVATTTTASDGDGGGDEDWVERPEQQLVNAIVSGKSVGHYHLFLGEKGTGKSSMQIEAMAKIDADGVSMFDAHADLEIVRIRLGKALNYEFHEDYIGGYFSERGPRESASALLDIERALNKLEKVALRRRTASPSHTAARPLVLIINQLHLLRDDEDGRDLIELLQQRAEQWAAAKLVTVVFNSDDYWVYERLKKLAARLEVHSIQDLPRPAATATLQHFRQRYFGERLPDDAAAAVYARVGGRLTFLNRVAQSRDMLAACDAIQAAEAAWFLNQCWILGADMDDDVMDQQKWAAAAMTLAHALVEAENKDLTDTVSSSSSVPPEPPLPSFAVHEAQQIMTRADFLREMDRRNLFSITAAGRVRAASVPMQRALRDICSQPGFKDHLDATVQRIADIESLGRTRELVAKDLVLGGRYDITAGTEATGGPFGKKAKPTEVRFRGWSPHERPPRDPPEDGDKK